MRVKCNCYEDVVESVSIVASPEETLIISKALMDASMDIWWGKMDASMARLLHEQIVDAWKEE